MQFRCSELCVAFGNGNPVVRALEQISFTCRDGEFLSLIGPSGCGKTTLLRTIAGILPPTSGTVTHEVNAAVADGGTIGQRLMVFQEESLFPWMTVLENAAFGLEMQGASREVREAAARELLRAYGLADRERAYPHQISVGMKQRVAVIRAFLSNPALLLMDEPFGALDSPTRFALQTDLLDLWSQSSRTVVFVTHDVDEAIYLSDRVLVMSPAPGRIVTELAIDLPRGRRRDAMISAHFLDLKRQLLSALSDGAESAAKEACHAA
jgi:NitT/TauT family transport system ATP-binding protein